MKALSYIQIISVLSLPAISSQVFAQAAAAQSSLPASSPFFAKGKLPFQAPDFSKIKDSDFKPAMEQGIKEALAEIEKIDPLQV